MTDRYHRQQQVPQLGSESLAKLSAAKVLLVGAGGLGSPVSTLLAGAGVGEITLIDHDLVSLSNLHRQTLFTEADIGSPKVLAAKNRLQAVNSHIKINAIQEPLSPTNAETLVSAHTMVVDAADSFFASYLLSDVCFKRRIPLVAASVLQTNGYVGVFCGTKQQPAPSMRAIFPSPPMVAKNCNTAGVTGPSVGVMGSYQAQEAIKIIMGDEAQLLGKLMYLDLWSYQQNIVDFSQAKEPDRFALLITELEINANDIVLDVRSQEEATQSPRSLPLNNEPLNIPVGDIAKRINELDKETRIVCVCKSGQRAMNAAQQLIEQGYVNVAAAL